MSINKATLRDDRRVSNLLKEQNRFIRELKTPQKVGADILQVEVFPAPGSALLASATIASGGGATFAATFTPRITVRTIPQIGLTPYIDPTSFTAGGVPDAAHQFSAGGSLTTGQKNLTLMNWLDWGDSSDIDKSYVYKIRIVNNDTASHVYYVLVAFYIPNMNQ